VYNKKVIVKIRNDNYKLRNTIAMLQWKYNSYVMIMQGNLICWATSLFWSYEGWGRESL